MRSCGETRTGPAWTALVSLRPASRWIGPGGRRAGDASLYNQAHWHAFFAFHFKTWQSAGGDQESRQGKMPPTTRRGGLGRGWQPGPEHHTQTPLLVSCRPLPLRQQAWPGPCKTHPFLSCDLRLGHASPPRPRRGHALHRRNR